MPDAQSDVIVVGAGIVGLAAAYNLARRGLSVRVFERGAPGGEQSSRAWGFIRQQGRHPAELPLAADASRRWQDLSGQLGVDVGFVRAGVLVTAGSAEDEARLAAAGAAARAHGITSRMVTALKIAGIVPDAQPLWRSGLFTPEDGQAEPALATAAFLHAARAAGVRIYDQSPVEGFDLAAGRIRGVRVRGDVQGAGAVLCAAGVATSTLLRTIGVTVPIKIVRSSVAMTNPAPTGSRTAVWTPDVSFRPRGEGGYVFSNGYHALDSEHDVSCDSFRQPRLFAASFRKNRSTLRLRFGRESIRRIREELAGRPEAIARTEPLVNDRWVTANHAAFCRVFPQHTELGIARRWAGRIDVTPDLIPILGRVEAFPGLYIAAGFSAHGFSLSPTVGALMSTLIADGTTPPELHPFRLDRFTSGDFEVAEAALV